MKKKETKGGARGVSENPNVDAGSTADPASSVSVTPYYIFEQCIVRARNLVSVHDSTEHIEEMSDAHYCDCYRAAIVLSISALDAYVRKVVVSEICKLVSDRGKPLSKELTEYLKNLLSQDKLLEAARKYDLIDSVETAIKEDISTKSFQGEWKITNHLKLVGHEDIFSKVSAKADINEKNLREKIYRYTNRRHVIAHSGDYDLNQTPHKENEITKAYAEDCIKIVSLFACTMNEIVEAK